MTPQPQPPILPNDADRCYVCGKPFEQGITVHRDDHGWRHPKTDSRCQPQQHPQRCIHASETADGQYVCFKKTGCEQQRFTSPPLAFCNDISHSSASSQQRIEQFDEILTDVAIMADESSIVGRDSIKKTERIYHEGSLFAYERMIGYLQKKKEKAIALLQEGRK